MSTVHPPATPALREREQAEVHAVLAALTRSPLMARLFSYVCGKYFDGESEQLSEIRIAVEVFGRSASFDRNQDAIARVEAHRLRKKLKQFYETEGKTHPIHIELPPGTYAPVFRHMPAAPPEVDPASPAMPPEASSEMALVGTATTPHVEKQPVQPRRHHWPWYAACVGVAAIAAFVVLRGVQTSPHPGIAGLTNTQRSAPAPPAVASNSAAIRFLCGYEGRPHIGRLGEVWTADRYYSGGRPWPERRGFIRRASDPFLFENSRTGEFSYDIPVKPGDYELHLYFVETEYGEDLGGGENTRTMLIRLNGSVLFQSFDPLSDAGGPRIADERIFKNVAPASDGKVHVSFESQRGQPAVSAVALVPMVGNKQAPIRLVTETNSYTDHLGQIWAPDNYYLGGQFFSGKPPVGNTADPAIFTSERAGNFSYAIPVDVRSRYTANLYFAETYFGPKASGVGGVGSRVFNVMCNGVMLLDHFDIYKEVGELSAVVKSFHDLRPNAQGKLILTFEPVANYASVFAVEVIDQSR
ncbi:MAG TPA: malectin domain-containing carbohydrate-binding protein [Bryobacteraceae bacterium]|nr:malectin domain-containing carbohydrate-binding protein [Bryobacteraceae bacterium]